MTVAIRYIGRYTERSTGGLGTLVTPALKKPATDGDRRSLDVHGFVFLLRSHEVCPMASERRFADVRRQLEEHGWRLVRISGSHHIFAKEGRRPLSIRVH